MFRLPPAACLSIAVLAATCAAFVAPSSAHAVVIAVGDGSGNTTAPANDPGWNNVGKVGGGTGIYLGDRWMLTANHVGASAVTFPQGQFLHIFGSDVQLHNPAGLGLSDLTDLVMFRLATDPGLPGMSLATESPPVGSTLTMIGSGKSRAGGTSSWNRTNLIEEEVLWTETSPATGEIDGFKVLTERAMRWGLNRVESDNEPDAGHTRVVALETSGDIIALTTRFDESPLGIANEAQAITGDSGGGAFYFSGGQWRLAGLINAFTPLPGQPADTVVYSNSTVLADIATYRDQILHVIETADKPWQNPTNRLDIDADGNVAPLDALVAINALDADGTRVLGPPGDIGPPPFYDVNGDNVLAPLDALLVINALDGVTAPAALALERSFDSVSTPEPGGLVLAGLGTLAGIGLSWRKRACRRRYRA